MNIANIGDTVTLRRFNKSRHEHPDGGHFYSQVVNQMQATVVGASVNGGLLRVEIAEVPAWFRQSLQERGIVLGAHASWMMFLWKNYEGQWTDHQTLDNFDIE